MSCLRQELLFMATFTSLVVPNTKLILQPPPSLLSHNQHKQQIRPFICFISQPPPSPPLHNPSSHNNSQLSKPPPKNQPPLTTTQIQQPPPFPPPQTSPCSALNSSRSLAQRSLWRALLWPVVWMTKSRKWILRYTKASVQSLACTLLEMWLLWLLW